LSRIDSGIAYSISSVGQDLTDVQTAIGESLYPDLPSIQTIFYPLWGRGSERFQGSILFDLAVSYQIHTWKKVSPWVKLEVRNLLDSTPLINYNIDTSPDPSFPLDNLGIPTGFAKESSFGKATAATDFPNPREFLMSAGIRF
jgi:hypothetical protein